MLPSALVPRPAAPPVSSPVGNTKRKKKTTRHANAPCHGTAPARESRARRAESQITVARGNPQGIGTEAESRLRVEITRSQFTVPYKGILPATVSLHRPFDLSRTERSSHDGFRRPAPRRIKT